MVCRVRRRIGAGERERAGAVQAQRDALRGDGGGDRRETVERRTELLPERRRFGLRRRARQRQVGLPRVLEYSFNSTSSFPN